MKNEKRKTGKRRERATPALARKIRAVRLFLCLTHGELLAPVMPNEDPLALRPMLSNWEAGKREPPRRFLVGLARLAHLSLEELLDDEIELSPNIKLYESVVKVDTSRNRLVYYWKNNLLPPDWQPVNEREHHAPKTIKPRPAHQPPSVQPDDAAEKPAQATAEITRPLAAETRETNVETSVETNRAANVEGNQSPVGSEDGRLFSDGFEATGKATLRDDLTALPPENTGRDGEAEELEEIILKLPVAVIDRLHDAYLRRLLAAPRRRRAGWSLDTFVADLLELPVGAPEIDHSSEYPEYNDGDEGDDGGVGSVGGDGGDGFEIR